jgi:hypothetical protein
MRSPHAQHRVLLPVAAFLASDRYGLSGTEARRRIEKFHHRD